VIFKFNPLHNFISPVTGRLPIDPNYVLIGDRNGMSVASPILIDLRLDLINLTRDFNQLLDTYFVLNYPSEVLENAQALSLLNDGFMYNTAGIISTTPTIPIGSLPDLQYHNIWIGNSSNRPEPNQRIDVLNLPSFLSPLISDPTSIPPGATVNFGLYNLYTGGINISVTEPIAPSKTLRVDTSNLPNLPKGKIWLGKINNTPPVITIDNIPPFVHVEGNLNWDVRGALSDDYAVPQAVGLSNGKIFMGDVNDLIIEEGLNINQLFSGNPDNSGKIIKIIELNIVNLPNLTYKAIWRGNVSNRPEETQDLTILEAKVTYIEDVSIPGLQTQIDAVPGLISTAIEALHTIITGEIAVSAAATLAAAIAALNAAIAALRLNNISADADVSFYNYKLINLADPVNQTDGVNLRTLIAYIGNIPSTIELVGDVTGSGNTGTPIDTTLELTLDQIKLAQNTVNLNNQKISNLKSDEVEQQDAINAKFLWDLMHDEVGVVWL